MDARRLPPAVVVRIAGFREHRSAALQLLLALGKRDTEWLAANQGVANALTWEARPMTVRTGFGPAEQSKQSGGVY